MKSGNSYIYDQPLSNTDIDYDVPPTRYGKPAQCGMGPDMARGSPGPPLDADYDIPPPSSGYQTPTASNDVYDCPPSMQLLSSESAGGGVDCNGSPLYDVPPSDGPSSSQPSNRSSVLSSNSSCRSSPTPSALINAGGPTDLYDVPRASADRSVAPPSRIPLNTVKGGARDSVLEEYSIPRGDMGNPPLPISAANSATPGEIYDTPPAKPAVSSSGVKTEYDNPVYDVPPVSRTPGSGTSPAGALPASTCLTSDSGVYDDDLVKMAGDRHLLASIRDQARGGMAKFIQLVSDSEVLSNSRVLQTPATDASVQPPQQGGQEGCCGSLMADTVRRNCYDLGLVFRHVEAQLDCLSRGQNAGSPQLADLVESISTVMKAVDQYCTVLSVRSTSNSPRSSTGTTTTATTSTTKTSNAAGSTPGSVTGTPTSTRGLPPPPVMPKPPSSTVSSRLCSPATPRMTDRPLPPPPSDAELARALETVAVVNNSGSGILSGPDRELVSFYGQQARAHLDVVESAATDFCRCCASLPVGDAPDPEVVMQRGKLVVLAGHKLVYIGDSVARHVTNSIVAERVSITANELCERLKEVVAATKDAAGSPGCAALRQRAVDVVREAVAASTALDHLMTSLVSGAL